MIDVLPELKSLTGQKREDRILRALTNPYNLGPRITRTVVLASTRNDLNGEPHTIEIETTPDYIGLDTPEGFVRLPMWPQTALKFLETMGWELPTPKIVNDIFFSGNVKLEPSALSTGYLVNNFMTRQGTRAYWEHSRRLNAQSGASETVLRVGCKKDVVVCHGLTTRLYKGNVGIYGWHRPNGEVIQGLNYKSHVNTYVDYSHGIRPIKHIRVDGRPTKVSELVNDPTLHVLVSKDPPFKYEDCYKTS